MDQNPATPPAPPPAPTPAPAAAPPTPPPAVDVKPMITLPADSYAALLQERTAFEQFRAEQAEAARKIELERQNALAAAGKSDELLKAARAKEEALNGRISSLEREALDGAKDRTVASLLAGVKFLSREHAAAAMQLLAPQIEAVRTAAGMVEVREKGGVRPAEDIIKGWLDTPVAKSFIEASTTGGTGTTGGNVPPPATPPAAKPMSVAEALLAQAREQRSGSGAAYGLTYRAPASSAN